MIKTRTDFVTNSSSSSFVIVSKVNKDDELLAYMKEEYGKYGLRLMDELLITGAHIRENNPDDLFEYFEDRDMVDQLEDDALYLPARFIAWTNDGDMDDDDAWLHDHIPEKYMEEIFRTSPY